MSRVFALDIESVGFAPQGIKNIRHDAYHKMQEEIELDRTLPKDQRQYIPKNLTDPAKINTAIEKKLAEGANLEHPKDALNPLTAKPICVCCVAMDESLIGHLNSGTPMNSYALQTFTDMDEFYHWAAQEVDQFIGFNTDQFDIPVLRMYQARTQYGVVPRVRAFWNGNIDLRREFGDLFNKGEVYSTPRDLRHYTATILDKEAQQNGAVKEFLETDFTGADVGSAYVEWENGGKEEIIRHCTLDTLMVAMIAVKLGIYR